MRATDGAPEAVAEAIRVATATLELAHVASPRNDAELLAAFVLGVPRGRLVTAEPFTSTQSRQFHELIRARATRVPLQHLTGTAPFRHLDLAVGAGVFVPRPETELLVEWGLRWLGRRPGAVVVDLCAGSGAIAAALAAELPATAASGTRVYAVERDPGALAWLHRNAAALAAADVHVMVVAGDATDPDMLAELDGSVDLVLCNPPYVPDVGAASLPPEVVDHDPRGAVFGGVDGLAVIRPLVGRIGRLLRVGGAFAIEHDDTHAYVVPALIDAAGRFEDVEVHHDLARRPRFTTATRAGPPRRVADLPP